MTAPTLPTRPLGFERSTAAFWALMATVSLRHALRWGGDHLWSSALAEFGYAKENRDA